MKHKSILQLLCLLGCFLGATGCVSTAGIPDAYATIAPDVSLAGKSTYAWYQEKPVTGQYLESGYTDVLNRHMIRAVDDILEQKGFRKVTSNPDLLVAYDVSVSVPAEKDLPELYAPGFGYSYAYEAGYRYRYGTSRIEGFRPIDLFKQGTLVIDLIDPATNQLIWRGWSEGAIKNFNANYKSVLERVQPILDNYPGR